MDPNFAPRHDIPNWNETRFFGHYSPESKVGIFVHLGRQRGFLDVWWSQIGVLLPDGRLLVDRQWQRTSDPMGLRGGNLTLVATQPRKTLYCAFDGGAQLCTEEQLARATRGDGADQMPLRWELQAIAQSEVWDMMAQPSDAEWAAGHKATHRQQHFACTGTLIAGNEVYPLDGPGYNDHSSGQRTWETFGGHWFMSAVFPDRSLFQISTLNLDGEVSLCVGAVMQNDTITYVTDADGGLMRDLLGGPRAYDASVTLEDGRTVELKSEVLATLPITINVANENLNGCEWEHPQDTVLYNEGWAKYTLSDGTVGYGHLERSARREWIDRDSLELTYPAERTVAAAR